MNNYHRKLCDNSTYNIMGVSIDQEIIIVISTMRFQRSECILKITLLNDCFHGHKPSGTVNCNTRIYLSVLFRKTIHKAVDTISFKIMSNR